MDITGLSLAIAVRIITSEENTSLVAIHDLRVPADWLSSRTVAKVLLIDGRPVAKTENVRSSVSSEIVELNECAIQEMSLCCVARLVDGKGIGATG